jgi:predicted anti-sigma-YlaC factor YlaD
MNCRDARRFFGAYWDDEITQAERDWLESHFAACAACRSEYESFAHALELVGSLPRAEIRPGLAERALTRARRAAPVADRLPTVTPRWIPITATAALVAIAATMTLQWVGLAPTGRLAPRDGSSVVSEPVLVGPPDLRATQTHEPTGLAGEADPDAQFAAGVPDSLFDHSADVEFILDPVTLRKGRAHTVLRLNPDVQGERAVITF